MKNAYTMSKFEVKVPIGESYLLIIKNMTVSFFLWENKSCSSFKSLYK